MIGHADLDEFVRLARSGVRAGETRVGKMLAARDPHDRQRANLLVSSAFAKAGDADSALAYLRRAYDVGPWSFDIFEPLYHALMDAGRVRDAIDCAREGLIFAVEQGNVRQVYALFCMLSNASAHPLRFEQNIPDPRGDRLMAWATQKVFSSLSPDLKPDVLSGRKIKVGLMLAGDAFENSAVTRTALSFARYHDPAKFEVHVYSYLTLSENRQTNPQYDAWLAEIAQWGCKFHEGVPAQGLARVLATAKAIALDDLDVLFFNMLVGDYYVLSQLRPAPVLIGNIHGDPLGYTSRWLDGSIAGDLHGQMESLTYSYYLRPFLDFEIIKPNANTAPPARSDFGIPQGEVLIVSGGQGYKLKSKGFWTVVNAVLNQSQSAHWLVVTDEVKLARKFAAELDPDAASRTTIVQWRRDYVENILPLADIVVDTFPAGGSLTLFWAMRHGKPCVAFRAGHAAKFSNQTWTGAFALLQRDDLAIPHGDTGAYIRRINHLVQSSEDRASFGKECQHAAARLSDHGQYMDEMQAAIVDAISRKLATVSGD